MKPQSSTPNISEFIISNTLVEKNLSRIFEDSIILNLQFEIVSVSISVLQFLNYCPDELIGKSIQSIGDEQLLSNAKDSFTNGLCTEKVYEIRTKKGNSLLVGISGFYLGLISDLNGYIILKIKNLDEVKRLFEQFQYKSMELDHFLYRASHDLRGPLATIQGLANVGKQEGKDSFEFYFNEISRQAERLDASLRSLMQLSNAGVNEFENMAALDFDKMEDILRTLVNTYGYPQNNNVHLTLKKFKCEFHISHTYLLTLLKNIIIFLFELAKKNDPSISISITSEPNLTKIKIVSLGFFMNDELFEKLNRRYFFCIESLKESNLLRFYAVKKIVDEIKGTIDIFRHAGTKHEIQILIPIS
jgi:signal transduction histidine kinase